VVLELLNYLGRLRLRLRLKPEAQIGKDAKAPFGAAALEFDAKVLLIHYPGEWLPGRSRKFSRKNSIDNFRLNP